MLIKYYIRRVLATGYGKIKFIKFLKGSRENRARISNIKGRKKRREHLYREIEKKGKEGRNNFFSKTPKLERI